jgi:hypothetical protein
LAKIGPSPWQTTAHGYRAFAKRENWECGGFHLAISALVHEIVGKSILGIDFASGHAGIALTPVG